MELRALAALIFTAYVLATSAYRWPSPQYDALEAFLYEGRRDDGSNMASLQHPCKLRSGTHASIGAEWLRLVYHDVATHNISDGTGGLDASIVFELSREENIGVGMNASLLDFQSFPNKYVSRADIIAIAATFAVASCGGPILPFRGGRVDALHAGPPGVPEPQKNIQTHKSIFAQQGFTQEDMIALVACGHTLGGVRSVDFPDIVPVGDDLSVVNFHDFDATSQYDNSVVLQYLDGSTSNPLVIGTNETLRSDLRIFSSDGNVTMQKLSSPDVFDQICSTLLERMLNIVPSNVSLTDQIQLLHAKVTSAQLTLEHDQLVFKTSLRLTQVINTTVNANRTVKILWCSRHEGTSLCADGNIKTTQTSSQSQDPPDISPITQRLGYYFVNYQFVAPIDKAESISTFWFEVDEHNGEQPIIYDNDGQGYAVDQDNILFVPMLSSISFSGPERSIKAYHLVAAVRDSINPSHVYMSAYDGAIPGFNPPLDRVIDLALNHTIQPVEGYIFYSGSVEDAGLQLTIDMHCDSNGVTYTQDFMQTFFLDISVPFSPPTTVQATSAALPGTTRTSTSVSPSVSSSSASGTFVYHSDFGSPFKHLAYWLVIYLALVKIGQ